MVPQNWIFKIVLTRNIDCDVIGLSRSNKKYVKKTKKGNQKMLSICKPEWEFLRNSWRHLYVPFIVISMVIAQLSLPDRAMAALITVDSLEDTQSDNDGSCTLREAIINANNNNQSGSTDCVGGSGADTIDFTVIGTITLGSTLPNITDPDGLTVVGGDAITVSGNNAVQVLIVNAGAELTLINLTVANGRIGSDPDFEGFGGGIANEGALTVVNSTFEGNHAGCGGGGILNEAGGILTVTDSTFSGNSAVCSGGGILNQAGGILTVTDSTFSGNNVVTGGGGISNAGIAIVTNSTFEGNSTGGFFGGGAIVNTFGTLTVTNSTFEGNSTGANGGGIATTDDSTLTVTNSTFSGNSAAGMGGAISNAGTAEFLNTIMANSPSGGNCSGKITDGGFNIDDGSTCGFNVANNSKPMTNPLLDPMGLKDNSGPTETIALLAGSPAINASNPKCPPPNTDQRGVARPQGRCDIGAFQAAGADVDKDGIPNSSEGNPPSRLSTEKDSSGGEFGTIQAQTIGTDGDEIPNFLDLDSDGDCIPDHFEAGGANDGDSDGIVDNFIDSDGDGLHDELDPSQGGTPLPLPDTDGDGIPDFLDTDSDGDGSTDSKEAGGEDEDGDGINDESSDNNRDGLADACHPDTGRPLPLTDKDGDGIPDHLDTTSGGGGCSVASINTTRSMPLYLLIPSLIAIRRVWRRYKA